MISRRAETERGEHFASGGQGGVCTSVAHAVPRGTAAAARVSGVRRAFLRLALAAWAWLDARGRDAPFYYEAWFSPYESTNLQKAAYRRRRRESRAARSALGALAGEPWRAPGRGAGGGLARPRRDRRPRAELRCRNSHI